MKRVMRILRTTAIIVSLLLCVTLLLLWVRSHKRWTGLNWDRGTSAFQVRSAKGVLAIQRSHLPTVPPLHGFSFWTQPKPPPFDWTRVPEGVIGITLPAPVKLEAGPVGLYQTTHEGKGRIVRTTRTYRLDHGLFPKQSYPGLKSWFTDMATADDQSIVMTLAP